MAVHHDVRGGQFLIGQTTEGAVFTPEDRSDEQRMIGATARQFITREIHPNMKQIENGDFDFVAEKMRLAGELGLLGHSIPECYGGLGLDKISKGIVGEALGSGGGYSVAHSNHTCIATLPITYFGTARQKEKYLPKLASGEFIGAYCLTEPEAGSDALSARTTAVLNDSGSHYLLNGTKIYITNAAFSDTFIVYAKVDGQHFSAFIVEKDFPGLFVGPEEQKMGIKGSSTCSIILDHCEVPVENLLGDVGKGHLIALNVLNLGRFNLGFATLGASKYAFQQGISHIKERKQFNRRIADFPATKEKITGMAVQMYGVESLLYRSGGHIEASLYNHDDTEETKSTAKAMNEHRIEAAICKVTGSETLDKVVDDVLQLHGGAGFMKDYPIEQAYRDSRINRIFEGTNEINRLLIPSAFLQKAAKGEFSAVTLMERAEFSLKNGGFKNSDSGLEAVALFKDLFLVSAGTAFRIYGESIKEEQEVLMKLADVAIEIYKVESAVIRTGKAARAQDPELDLKEMLTTALIEQSALDVQKSMTQLLSALLNGEERVQTLRRMSLLFSEYQEEGSIERNRRVADRMIEAGQYIS